MSEAIRVLITEDEALVAMDLERRLRKMKFDVVGITSTGEDAIRLVQELQPDLVLMDIRLGGLMDGIEASRTIQERGDVAIVYLSANSDEITLQRAKATHPSSYLLKPFRERELQICVEMALANHRLQRALRESHAELERRVAERTRELSEANDALRREVSERKRAEALAREQAALLDKASDAIFVRHLDGRILYWNHSAELLYGVTQTDAQGRQADEILEERPLHEGDDPIPAVLRSGEWVGRMVHVRPPCTEVVVESRWTLVRDTSGQPESILVVATDVTEKMRLEEEYLRAQRMEGIGALAGGIAHDLNNVFTPLIISSQSLEDAKSAAEVRHIAELIQTASLRGADLVKQILTFVRGGAGDHRPLRLEHLVKDVQRLLRETFPDGTRLRLEYAPELWSVPGDATKIHQLLMNLCVNARDALPEGGDVTVRLDNFSVDAAFAELDRRSSPGDYVRIRVSDTGVGMTPEVRKRIFEPFFTTKPAGKGTGLGLSIVQTIVRDHRGFLDVESEPGAGTTFHVCLPACARDQLEGQEPAEPPPRGAGERILVADDERAVREILRAVLEAHGYRVLLASDGVDAISQFAANPRGIAAVIADYAMPLLDGFGCAQGLRRIAPELPILMLSGRDSARLPFRAIEELRIGYLDKPFTKAQLVLEVNRMLRAAGSGVRR